MKASLASLEDAGPSLCYGYHYYDWAIVLGRVGQVAWQHECHSPAERSAGDGVVKCEDFREGTG